MALPSFLAYELETPASALFYWNCFLKNHLVDLYKGVILPPVGIVLRRDVREESGRGRRPLPASRPRGLRFSRTLSHRGSPAFSERSGPSIIAWPAQPGGDTSGLAHSLHLWILEL